MIEQQVRIDNWHGLPMTNIYQTAQQFEAQIELANQEQKVDGKNIMGLTTFQADCGTNLTIIADGADEEYAIEELQNIL
ncbi:HPr family phosphocarrier protein [Halanaerobaculum tunisiense]